MLYDCFWNKSNHRVEQFRKAVPLLKNHKEKRTEAIESGTVHLVGTNYQLIVDEVSTLIEDPAAYEKMSKAVNPYGDGHACERIVKALIK